ncbi:MAG: rhodanese-like domain-containing protein [Sulfobacillus acidophilus]|uniref:Rhodanese-like domain-containing protein n=1 Tax=Sulfobacillus acidophilus TaxID=53633 RepID=A0A2T2WD59_9FIRM|nr:MAG: rhodanese-like domain-containing protein [Sulfobacillus acidophilus]
MNFTNLFRHPSGLVDLTPDELEGRLGPSVLVIDVRTHWEYARGHIAGAISIPLGREDQVVQRWSPDSPLVLVCKTGHRSQAAAATLFARGFEQISHLAGGMDAWRLARKPTTLD